MERDKWKCDEVSVVLHEDIKVIHKNTKKKIDVSLDDLRILCIEGEEITTVYNSDAWVAFGMINR